MTENTDDSAGKDKTGWSNAAIAGAAIGSAALAAALLFVSRRSPDKVGLDPLHPETAPETD